MDSDVGVRKTTAQLVRIGKDKKLVKAMQAPMGAEEPELGPAPEMGAMSAEDEELAAGLAYLALHWYLMVSFIPVSTQLRVHSD